MTSISGVLFSILLMKIHGAALDTVNIGSFHTTLPSFLGSNSNHAPQFLSIVNQFDLLFLSLSRSCLVYIEIFSAFLANHTNYRVKLNDRKGNALDSIPIVYNPVKLTILECEEFDKTAEENYIITFCTVYIDANDAIFTSIGFKTLEEKSIGFFDRTYEKMIANYMSFDRSHPIIFLGNINFSRTRKIFKTNLVQLGSTEFNERNWLLFCHGQLSRDMILVFGSMRSAFIPGSTAVLQMRGNVLFTDKYTRCPVRISINPAEISNRNSRIPSVELGQEVPPRDNHNQRSINHLEPSRVTQNSFNIISPPHKYYLAQNTAPYHTQQTDYDHSLTSDDFPSTSYKHTYTAVASNAVYNDANRVYCGNSQPIHYNQRVHDGGLTQSSVSQTLNTNGGSTYAFVPYKPHQSYPNPYLNILSNSSQTDNLGSENYVENHSQPRVYNPQMYANTDPSSLAHQQWFGSMNPFTAPSHDTYFSTAQAGPSRAQPVEHTPGLMVVSSSDESAPSNSTRDCVQGDITYSSAGANFVSAYDCDKDYTELNTWNEEDVSFPSVIFDDNLPQI